MPRVIKNEDEIACMRMACNSATAAFYEIKKALVPGVRECDLVGVGMKKLSRAGLPTKCRSLSAPPVPALILCTSTTPTGPSTPATWCALISTAIRIWAISPAITARLSAARQPRSKSRCTRTAARVYDGMEGIKAGNSTADIVKGWPQSPKYWGYENWLDVAGYALGHGLGLSLHEAPQFFRPYTPKAAHTVLEEGMVMAVETWTGGVDPKYGPFGVRLEEDIVVTKDGYELLTKFPVETITECLF